ncbi:MAG: CRTAC1 family protein, partial [Rhodothermales bacterium]
EAGKFVEVEPAGGVITSSISTSRGTALADIDNDGDLDIAVINNHGSIFLLENIVEKKGDWIGFSLTDNKSVAETRLKVKTSDKSYSRTVFRAGSYQSSNSESVHIGLPGNAEIQSVEIVWPDGTSEVLGTLETNQYHQLSKSN